MHSALVNSVMIRPQPPSPRIMRRKTVSVTPAIGAKTVAGATCVSRIVNRAGSMLGFVGSTVKFSPVVGSLILDRACPQCQLQRAPGNREQMTIHGQLDSPRTELHSGARQLALWQKRSS